MTDFDRQNTKFLYKQADATSANIADDSILARMMAVDGDASDYNDNTMSLEAVAAAISAQDTDIAKVPHSDGTATFNATALGSINAEVDTALNTAVPASPTVGSVNDIMSKAAGGNTFIKATDSLEALSEKIDTVNGLHDVPTKDSTDDANIRDVAGKKDDTGVEVVGTTKTLQAYAKGLIQELAQRNVGMCGELVTSLGIAWQDVVNITDKGVLTGISVSMNHTAAYSVKVRITIDGTVVRSGIFADTHAAEQTTSLGLAFNHRFDTSLRVENYNSAAGATYISASYTKDA